MQERLLKWWKLDVPERKFCFESKEGFSQIPCETVEIMPDRPETAHLGILQNFTNCILHGEPLLAPGYDGVKELSISNAAYLSSCSDGAEIKLPFTQADADRFASELQTRAEKSNYKETYTAEKMSGEYSKRWQVRW